MDLNSWQESAEINVRESTQVRKQQGKGPAFFPQAYKTEVKWAVSMRKFRSWTLDTQHFPWIALLGHLHFICTEYQWLQVCNQQKEKRKYDRKTQCRSARTCKRLIRGGGGSQMTAVTYSSLTYYTTRKLKIWSRYVSITIFQKYTWLQSFTLMMLTVNKMFLF